MRRHTEEVVVSYQGRHATCAAQGQEKMSKSDPNSAIFMEDAREDVDRKIKKAFCPPQVRLPGAQGCALCPYCVRHGLACS